MTDEPIVVPDRKGLREFAFVTGGTIAALFGVVFPWLLERGWPLWPWVLLALLGGTGLVAPQSLAGVYYWWMRFAQLLSKITTPVIMAVVYYLVVTPMGLVIGLIRDSMERGYDSSAESYRVSPTYAKDKGHLERPF